MSADYVRFAVGHAAHYSVMFESAPGESASEALKQAAMQSFLNLVGAVAAVVPDVPQDEVVRRAILGWSLAHGAVDVAHLVGTLDPSFDLEALAERVGEGVLAHALG
jgi:hypothetical protein